jgi:hypothetical protein
MIPGHYEYLASSYPVETVTGETDIDWDGTDAWEELGRPIRSTCPHAVHLQCDHCGASHRYQTILRYLPTGEILSVGQTCAAQRFGRPDWVNVIADGARRAELKAQRNGRLTQAFSRMDEETRAAFQWARDEETANPIARDIALKVERFGPLTDKQASFLVKLHKEAQEKTRQLDAGEIAPCPSGKVTVTGSIVSVKRVLDEFRSTRWATAYKSKILVQDDRGFRVFGSLPTAAAVAVSEREDIRGMRLSFTCDVEPKNDDPTFGFFKRPTKVNIL